MNKCKEAARKMASLSVYKGILKRTVPAAFYRLLWAASSSTGTDGGIQEFLTAWGDFFAVLCERGYSESLTECVTQTALYDENAFSLAAAAGETDLPKTVMDAVERDLQIILDVSSITPQELIDSCAYAKDIAPLCLPQW